MAKVTRKPVSSKSTKGTKKDGDSFVNDIASSVNSKFGSGTAMVMGNEESSEMLEVPFWIVTGIPELDYAVGGKAHPGIPGGRLIEVYGPESNGKTTVAMWILKQVIDQMDGIGVFQDTEHSLSEERAEQMGLDMTKVVYSQPDIMEDVFEAQESIIEAVHNKGTKRPVAIVWDSIAATSTKSEVEGEYGDAVMGIHARIMSQALRKIKGKIKKMNVAAIYINQIRDKMNVSWGAKTDTFGGRAMKFYSSVRMEVKKIETLKKEKDGNIPYGIRVRVTVSKNKVSAPFRKAEFDILFDEKEGVIDSIGATLDWLKEHKLMEGSSGWYEIDGKKYRREEARDLLKSDNKLMKKYTDMAYSVE